MEFNMLFVKLFEKHHNAENGFKTENLTKHAV